MVRTKHFFVRVMTPEEAILQMNLLDHEFFMFRDDATGEINVVYRRKDGTTVCWCRKANKRIRSRTNGRGPSGPPFFAENMGKESLWKRK